MTAAEGEHGSQVVLDAGFLVITLLAGRGFRQITPILHQKELAGKDMIHSRRGRVEAVNALQPFEFLAHPRLHRSDFPSPRRKKAPSRRGQDETMEELDHVTARLPTRRCHVVASQHFVHPRNDMESMHYALTTVEGLHLTCDFVVYSAALFGCPPDYSPTRVGV